MDSPLTTRRTLLRTTGVAAAAGLAGCTSLFGPETTELVVHNERETALEVAVTVTARNRDDPLLDAGSVAVDPGEERLAGEFTRVRGLLVTVDERGDAPAEEFRLDDATPSIHVYVHAEGMDFVAGSGG